MTDPRESLRELCAGRRVTVVGVGSELRGDDGVGPYVAGLLATRCPGRALDAGEVPENHLGAILAGDPEVVLFVDAADHGGAPGDWRLVRLGELEPRCGSTHDPSLALLGRVLESQGPDCRLLGIQPAHTGFGAALSGTVRASAEDLATLLSSSLSPGAAHA